MTYAARPEWVGDARVMPVSADDPPTLSSFAFDDTLAILQVEPRLVALAGLVERAGLTDDDDLWSGVDQLAALLVGPTRSASQITPVTAVSIAVSGSLSGATTRARFIAALRATSEVAT